MRILCVDAGSSSLKLAVYDARRDGELECLTSAQAPLRPESFDAGAAVEQIVARLPAGEPLDGIGHRVVFGGPQTEAAVRADAETVAALESIVAMEPLHLRTQLDLIAAIASRRPQLPQVLCFDTVFHNRMPDVAKRLAIPPRFGPAVRRYGFHGLSYEYVVSVLDGAPGRTVVAHLGSGASLCAIRDGVPVDTTMGFSPLSGLVMATRPGDLDPGAILEMLRQGESLESLRDLLYRGCGLAGLSGSSGDLRELIAAAPSNARARDAIALFEYEVVKHMGAMIAALGGLDTIVFTGGVGENQPSVRSNVCKAFRFLGVRVNEEANARNAASIAPPHGSVDVRVVAADENLMVARHTAKLL